MKRTISRLAVPLLLTLTSLFGYQVIHQGWNFELTSYAYFLFVLAYILILERLIPLKEKWKTTTLGVDIKHLIFSVAVFDALGKVLALSAIGFLHGVFFSGIVFWDEIPFWLAFVMANLIGELFPYIYHRISHVGNSSSFFSSWLWKVHSIHHISTSLNWFKTNWIHPINMFLNTTLKMLPILILGFDEALIFSVGITHMVIAYLSHANISTKKSIWDYLVVTPRIHHFHHSKILSEAKNFGNTFPFWDLVFGSYYNREGAVDQVGVVDNPDADYPAEKKYMAQLIFPLRISKKCCATPASI